MSAHVKLEVISPLGTVTVAQQAGRASNYGPEIEHANVRSSLVAAVMQAAGAFDIRPAEIADSILAVIAEEAH